MPSLSELLIESVVTQDPDHHHTLGVVVASNATGVPSAPSDLQVVLMSMRFVTLSWAAPVHSGLSDVVGYSVFWKEDLSDRSVGLGFIYGKGLDVIRCDSAVRSLI